MISLDVCSQFVTDLVLLGIIIMDVKEIKQEPVEHVAKCDDCEIIVVDLTSLVQKDAGQTIAKLKAHISLKLNLCWLVCLFVLVLKCKFLNRVL